MCRERVNLNNLRYNCTSIHLSFSFSLYYFMYEGDMRTCLCALTAGKMPIVSKLLLVVLDVSMEPWANSLRQPHCPLLCPVLLPLSPESSFKKWFGISHMVSAPNMAVNWLEAGRLLHWAVYTWHWHIGIVFVWRRHENIIRIVITVPCKQWCSVHKKIVTFVPPLNCSGHQPL